MSDSAKGLHLERAAIGLAGRRLLALDRLISPGEVLTVMGPSGSGKSTLLSFVAGFLDPVFAAEGRVLIDGEDVTALPAEARHLGLLFQDPLLFPHLSVGQNLLFGLDPSVAGGAERRKAAETALAGVGMEGFFARDPATLSGGQKARIALLRTLLARPRALLLDEPFSRLDAELKGQVRALVFAEAAKRGLPVLLVTHDPADAEAAGGPVVDLAEGEGR